MDGVRSMLFFPFRARLGLLEGMGGSGTVGGAFCGSMPGAVIAFPAPPPCAVAQLKRLLGILNGIEGKGGRSKFAGGTLADSVVVARPRVNEGRGKLAQLKCPLDESVSLGSCSAPAEAEGAQLHSLTDEFVRWTSSVSFA